MATASPILVIALCGAALAATPTASRGEDAGTAAAGEPPQVSSVPGPQAAPVDQWLDEVRAQRQAWEERRQAQKEAMEARRRWIDPWGAAQHEAREQEITRRREAFRDHIERDRETFFNQAPWGNRAPWPDDPAAPDTPDERSTASEPGEGGVADEHRSLSYPPLPGWDNRWYFRGF